MEESSIFQAVYEWFRKFLPFLLVGMIGSVLHRLRTDMTFKAFLSSLVISAFVSLSVGVVAQEYTLLYDDVIFVLCGISGMFSKLLLDELEEIIADLSTYFKEWLGKKKGSE